MTTAVQHSRIGRGLCAGAVLLLATACAHSRSAAPADGPTAAAEDSVYIGYGSEARSESTGSVSTLSGDDLTQGRYHRIEEILGRVPGVQVDRSASGGYTVRIRGTRSLMSNNDPIVVVDGIVRDISVLESIPPDDVARIDVLKDASTEAMYGSRGANGVIVITTKR
ncbi:MAG TPA: TonB-dependent receptor plug domain-containing protein [Longimicrobiaceae bacterium]|nr:TonB-dependent receptor plug domain-containing protein [Longimicrobiaceae bacterium]